MSKRKRILATLLAVVLIASLAIFTTSCGNKAEDKPVEPVEESQDIAPTEEPESQPESQEEAKEEQKDTDQAESEEAQEGSDENKEEEPVEKLPNPLVTIQMDDGKEIVIELLPEYAPNTVNNFVDLVQKGFYDGLTFHRIVDGFMVQGGDPDGNGTGGPGYGIHGEFIDNGFDNRISHKRGIVSMARSGDPNSAGSQFFIVTSDSTFLDKQYAAFGIVIDGMDVADEIVSAPIVEGTESPQAPRIMEKVTVDTQGIDPWPAPETTPGA